MQLSVRANGAVPGDPTRVFDVATSCEGLPRFIRPHAPIPGIERAEMLGGASLSKDAPRRVTMTDRSVIEEVVTAFDPPRLHAYRWTTPPAFPLSLLVRTGAAEWRFASEGSATRVDWEYTFELTSVVAYPFAALLMVRFRQWMQQSLERLPSAV